MHAPGRLQSGASVRLATELVPACHRGTPPAVEAPRLPLLPSPPTVQSAFEAKHVKQFIESVRLVGGGWHRWCRACGWPRSACAAVAVGVAGCCVLHLYIPHRCPLFSPRPCRQGFESVADVAGVPAKVEARTPWDGGEGEAGEADEFDLADLMKEEL